MLTAGHPPFWARQIRSPKSEMNSKSEGSRAQNGARLPGFAIRISDFRVCFEFRISDFGFWARTRFLCGTIVKTRKLFLHERLASSGRVGILSSTLDYCVSVSND